MENLLPSQALSIILDQVQVTTSISKPLTEAFHQILSQDLYCPIDHPLFDQTAVDGYAFRHADFRPHSPLTVVSQIRAGDQGLSPLQAHTCARIFTGAPLPPGADTIVMQEHVKREGDEIWILNEDLQKGAHVRYKGEQIQAGQLALPKGTRLDAATLGFLASIGISTLQVQQPLSIGILVTGDEFAQTPEDLKRGQIFESNGIMLKAALHQFGFTAHSLQVPDDLQATQAAIRQAANQYDLLILTGGVSVGDYDHTRPALEVEGFETVFHKVQQKPGKPLLFSRRGQQVAFGLPGNPRAVLVCFYHYVLPYLQAATGRAQPWGLKRLQLPLTTDHRRKPDGKTHFVTGKLTANGFTILDGQNSHMLLSFAQADVLATLPPEGQLFPAGTPLEVLLLP